MATISLCMIVRDEESVLGRCLESVKDIADEIIIVDTGSVDRTKDVAKLYTDKIYDFTWIDHFSAARNYSFSKASGDYCMWMDADDLMKENEKKKLKNWKKNGCLEGGEEKIDLKDLWPDVVMMKYATAFDENGKVIFSFYRERLLKRDKGFLWKGRVHEVIEPFGNIEYLDISVEHHSTKKEYGDRNLRIYEKMRSEDMVFGARDLFYYARELYYHNHYEEAVDNFMKFLKMEEGFVENKVEACRLAAYCCYRQGDGQRALGFLMKGLEFRVPGGELCCDIGQHFYDREEWEQAIFWYRSALRVPKKEFTGGFLSEECYGYLPCIQLSVCYFKLGKRKRAFEYHCLAGRCKPYGKEYLVNKKYFEQENVCV